MEPKWEIFRENLASMNQIMPNSQETVLKITLTEALVLTRHSVDEAANGNLPLLSLLFKVEAIYPLRAPGSDIMMVNLAIVIQIMPNSQEI